MGIMRLTFQCTELRVRHRAAEYARRVSHHGMTRTTRHDERRHTDGGGPFGGNAGIFA